MNDADLVTVAKYQFEHEAQLAAERLETAGIASVMHGRATSSMLGSYWGANLAGVQLQVRQSDLSRARTIIKTHADGDSPEPTEVMPWQCENCGMQIADGFEVCWQCGSMTAADGIRSESAEATDSRFDDGSRTSVNPEFAMPDVQFEQIEPASTDDAAGDGEESLPGDRFARSAFRAAIFSLVVPVLIPFAVFLQLQAIRMRTSPHGSRRIKWATALIVLNVAAWAIAMSPPF